MGRPILLRFQNFRIPWSWFTCNCSTQGSSISMRNESNSPAPTNVQDSGRITFSDGFNTCFIGLSSTTTVFSAQYLPPKPENKCFWMDFKNSSFYVPFTFMYDTFPRSSWTRIRSQDSWSRIFKGFTGKPSNRRLQTDLTVDTLMELQIVISATLPSSVRNLLQDGRI
jgi:hypothetical protein